MSSLINYDAQRILMIVLFLVPLVSMGLALLATALWWYVALPLLDLIDRKTPWPQHMCAQPLAARTRLCSHATQCPAFRSKSCALVAPDLHLAPR
jgi:hypothetical protein